jgi:hypothetical protein
MDKTFTEDKIKVLVHLIEKIAGFFGFNNYQFLVLKQSIAGRKIKRLWYEAPKKLNHK